MFRHGSLFSGIGGFDLAAQWMGWENVFQVEWDKWCQKVLAKNFPDSLRFGDIVEFNKMLKDGEITTDTGLLGQAFSEKQTAGIVECCETNVTHTKSGESRQSEAGNGRQDISRRSEETHEQLHIGRINILTGGFPCQPFSHAGKRKGTDDSRYLWPEMLTTIRILKPSFVIGENVAGLVSMENGKTLDGILSDLENEGYQTEQFIIPACGVGAWHRRDRIWIIAHNGIKPSKFFRNNKVNIKINGKSQKKTGNINGGSNYSDVPNTNISGLQEQGSGQQTDRIGQLHEAISNPIGQRGCSRDTEGEYAEDVRQQSGSTQYGYWNSEPSVGRVVARLSSTLDETLNDYKNGNANDQETITKVDLFRGQILRDMWGEQCSASETSHQTRKRQSDDFMLSMSHGYSHERWKLGQRLKDNKDLSDLWQRILSTPLKETQDLQSRMLERIREIECNEKVASSRIDRLKGLGNAIVPQIAFQIFKAIEEFALSENKI